MKEKAKLRLVLYFTASYLLLSAVVSILNQNYEFLYYTALVTIILIIIVLYHKRMHLPFSVMLGLTGVGVLHFAGGSLYLGTTRLYDLWLIPEIFKYDNLVHMVAIFVATFALYSLLYPHLDKALKHSKFLLSVLLILLAAGLGALHEILELIAVLFFDAQEQVGDYFNNIFDLFFNMLGAIAACLFLMYYYKKKHK